MKKIGLFVLLLLFSLLSLVIGVKDIALSQLFQLDAQRTICFIYHPCSPHVEFNHCW